VGNLIYILTGARTPHHFHIGSITHKTTYPKCTAGFSLRVKQSEYENYRSLSHLVSRLGTRGALLAHITRTPLYRGAEALFFYLQYTLVQRGFAYTGKTKREQLFTEREKF
jgi:hypothetical protein